MKEMIEKLYYYKSLSTSVSSIQMHYILLVTFPHISIICVTVSDTILFIIFIM